MPIITVDMLEGRTDEQKQALVRELTDALVRTCGGQPEAVQIVVRDVTQNNWAKGGKLLSDH